MMFTELACDVGYAEWEQLSARGPASWAAWACSSEVRNSVSSFLQGGIRPWQIDLHSTHQSLIDKPECCFINR